jgi:hypothetical protein
MQSDQFSADLSIHHQVIDLYRGWIGRIVVLSDYHRSDATLASASLKSSLRQFVGEYVIFGASVAWFAQDTGGHVAPLNFSNGIFCPFKTI